MNLSVDKSLHTVLPIFLSKIPRNIFISLKAMNTLKAFYTNYTPASKESFFIDPGRKAKIHFLLVNGI